MTERILPKPRRVEVRGVPVDTLNMSSVIEYLEQHLQTADQPGYVLAINPEKVYALRANPRLAAFFAKALLLIPDGIGVVLAIRLLHGGRVARVPGVDLMHRILALAAKRGTGVYLYGGKEETSQVAAERLLQLYPGLRISGRSNGYVPQAEEQTLVERINDSGADILFVGLGSPRQEEWIERHIDHLHVKLIQGIGGSLDTVAGTVKRAPDLFLRLGLEWFYRLLAQPSRWRRQIILPRFACAILLDYLSQRTGPRN